MTTAVSVGLTPGDLFPLGLLFAGLAVFVAVGALSHQHERAFSASVIYLGLGLCGAIALDVLGVQWIDPLRDHRLVERLSELAVVIALFGTGLRLDRPLSSRHWASMSRLLVVAMPLTIAAVAGFGAGVMGLSAGAAVILGAALAPTDPVLAGDVGVGPPGEGDEREPNFALTAEAGLNDGLALPFLLLGAVIAGQGSYGSWAVGDVLFAIPVGLAAGGAGGWLLAAATVRLRDADLLEHDLDGWLAVAAVLVLFGATQFSDASGFLAAFAGGVGFRRYERHHELQARIHHGAEIVEKFAELALILLLGSMVTIEGLGEPGLSGWLLVPVLLVVIRPVTVMLSLLGSRTTTGSERLFVAWFGVRGVGSLYYAALAVGLGVLTKQEEATVFWTVIVCVGVSILVHGVSASPLSRRLLRDG